MAKNNNDEFLKYAKYAGIGLVAYTVLRPILASAQAISQTAVGVAETKIVQQNTGLSSDKIKVCKDVAYQLNYAMYDRSSLFTIFGGSFEDEARVVKELNRISSMEEAVYVSEEYFRQTKGKSLKLDVDTYLEPSDIKAIPSAVYTGLK